MHSAHGGDKGLAYVPYVSNPQKYRDHFASSTNYDPSSFHLIGDIRSLPMTGEGKATVKLISPSEGAVQRAKEELSNEIKEEVRAKRLHSFVGRGRRRIGRGKSKRSKTPSKARGSKKKAGGKSKSRSKKAPKKGGPKKKGKSKGGRRSKK